MGFNKGKQKTSGAEPQEKEIFKKCEFPTLHKQYESCNPKESWLRTTVSKQDWKMDQVSPQQSGVHPPSLSAGSQGYCVLVWGAVILPQA